jgi:predicted dehydrogenase
MKKVSLGLIGLGYIGQAHLQNGLLLTNSQITSVADLSKKALDNAKDFGVKTSFTNYKQLLKDPKIEGVIIALPTHLHLECAREAAEAGKHILLEKPMARNTEEAKEIFHLAQKNNVKLMVGYTLRFNPIFRRLKEQIDAEEMGAVEFAHGILVSSGPFFHRNVDNAPVPVPEWWFNKSLTGGGVLIDLGCHIINLLRWYFGEIVEIRGCFRHRFNLDFEDGALCTAKFSSGPIGVINVGWFSNEYKLKVELLGSVRHLEAENLVPSSFSNLTQAFRRGVPSKFRKPLFDELNYFANCLAKDLSPKPSGEDGIADLAAIESAYANGVNVDV